MDIAEGVYQLDVCKHLPGALNGLADKLSRVSDPNVLAQIPGELAGIEETSVELRAASWWRACAGP